MTRNLTLILTLLPATAFAHVGDHGELSMARAVAHAASQPDHVLSLVAVVATVSGAALLRRLTVQKVRR